MTKRSSSVQRDLLNTTLKALIVLLLLRGCDTTLSNIDLSTTTLDPATTGFMITGNAAGDMLGYATTAGDINNDGYEDIIASSPKKNYGEGVAYVIYGGPTSSMSNLDLNTTELDPATTGFTITGRGYWVYFGVSASTAGDINNDGYDDIIVGAPGQEKFGAVYVIYGGPKSSMSNIDLHKTVLDPATTGFEIITGSYLSSFGSSASTAGDINNDGYDDIIVGAPLQGLNRGAAYVIYGGPKSSMDNIDLGKTPLDPETTGFMITGNANGDSLGPASTARDIDNDGYDDIIVGAPFKSSQRGAAYVIYGGPKSSMSNIDLSRSILNPLSTGFMITGNAARDNFGGSTGTAGDLNNDGYMDIIVGACNPMDDLGKAYVIYGGPRSSMSNIDLSQTALDPATTGFTMTGNPHDEVGSAVDRVGDIDNDGYDDIIVGVYSKNNSKGAAYVIYGGPKSSLPNIDLGTTTLDPATTGFMITGNAAGDVFGSAVSTVGDINHDGYDDISVTAIFKDSEKGAAYVIYGGPRPSTSNIAF